MKSIHCISIILLSLFFSVCEKANAQVPDWLWAKSFITSDNAVGKSIRIDASGNIYTTGHFSGITDFDPGPDTFNINGMNQAIFVSKLDSSGNFIWAKVLNGTTVYSSGNSLEIDSSGNIYLTGDFNGTLDFDPGPGIYNLTSNGYSNIFICKLDNAGNFIWVKSINGDSIATGTLIKLDKNSNIFITGSFRGTFDFNADSTGNFNLTSNGATDIFISKYDSSGIFGWAKSLGSSGTDNGNAIAIDDSGNVYATGMFSGTVDFNPDTGVYSLNSVGSADIYILKLDSSGNFIWAQEMAATTGGSGKSIAVDPSGNICLTGNFNSEMFIAKLSNNGTSIWTKTLYGGDYSEGNSVTIDDVGNVYYAGEFSLACDFDPGSGSFFLYCQSYSCFVSKLDSAGNFIYAKGATGTCDKVGTSIALSPEINNVVLTGYYYDGFAGFDGTYLPNGNSNYNIFISKLSLCNSSSSINQTACFSYTSPSGNNTWTNSGIYKDTIPNATGCDSAITINLTVFKSDTTVIQNGNTLNAAFALGALYQWLDCNNGFSPINGATNNIFIPSSNGYYAVSVTRFNCTDTSSCYLISGVGINEISPHYNAIVYPNPASDLLTISYPSINKTSSITITDITGQTIYQTNTSITISTQKTEVNTKEFSPGVYLIKIQTEDFVETKKFIVRR